MVDADDLAGRADELSHRDGEIAAAAADVEGTAPRDQLVAQLLQRAGVHVRCRDRDPPSDRLRRIAEAAGRLAAVVLPVDALHALAHARLREHPARPQRVEQRRPGRRA